MYIEYSMYIIIPFALCSAKKKERVAIGCKIRLHLIALFNSIWLVSESNGLYQRKIAPFTCKRTCEREKSSGFKSQSLEHH